MDRRTYLSTSAAILSGVLAGCTDTLSDDPESSRDQTLTDDRLPRDEYPVIQWQEEWVTRSEYRLSVTVEFNGADTVVFEEMGGEVLEELEQSTYEGQTVTIAGEETRYGLVESLTMITVTVDQGELPDATVDTYMVGTEDQPSRPFHLTGLSGNTSPDLDDDQTFKRSFSYDYEGATYRLSLTIPESLYNYYTERIRTPNRGAYVADPYQKPYLSALADEFGDRGSQETVNKMMAFVQQLPYTEDQVSAGIRQYTTYPLETLFDEGGDCEDTAILLAALMEQAGFDTVLLAFWDEQHMALGVAGEESISGSYYEYNGTRYYYLETTAPGWKVGQVPPRIKGASAEIQEIRNHPTLVFGWSTMPALEDEGVEVDIVVRNEGDVRAQNVHLTAYFENRDGRVVASKNTSRFQVRSWGVHEETITLVPPDDVEVRCVMDVFVDGDIHDRAKSEWREPDHFMPD